LTRPPSITIPSERILIAPTEAPVPPASRICAPDGESPPLRREACAHNGGMVRITGEQRIRRPSEVTFDCVADSRNEPSYNTDMTSCELLTPEPVGEGSRFRAVMRGRAPMDITLTEYDRPRRLGSSTTSPQMETNGTITFTWDGEATVMRWDWQARPKGWLRLLGPLFGTAGRRMERRIWASLRDRLEAEPDR
jgi:hypothetical protein